MDAVRFFEEIDRMCKTYPNCEGCPLDPNCECSCIKYSVKTVEIVEKWAEEHPGKTILMDFLEKFPNAKLRNDGIPPGVCPDILGYSKIRRCERSCVDCWNRPI